MEKSSNLHLQKQHQACKGFNFLMTHHPLFNPNSKTNSLQTSKQYPTLISKITNTWCAYRISKQKIKEFFNLFLRFLTDAHPILPLWRGRGRGRGPCRRGQRHGRRRGLSSSPPQASLRSSRAWTPLLQSSSFSWSLPPIDRRWRWEMRYGGGCWGDDDDDRECWEKLRDLSTRSWKNYGSGCATLASDWVLFWCRIWSLKPLRRAWQREL